MIEYILLSGFAGGAVFGFILKWYLCKDEEPIISESDSPRSDTSYVNFLEDMLDNTTHITKPVIRITTGRCVLPKYNRRECNYISQ